MIRPQGRHGFQVAPYGIRVPVIPAEPPVVRRRVVQAEAVTRQIQTGAPGLRHVSRWIREATPCGGHCSRRAASEIVPHYFGPGTGFITFQVDDVRIPAIKPDCLQNIIDCLIRMMLNGALSNVQLPFNALSAGAFKLILEQGPQIDNDMVEVWGSI